MATHFAYIGLGANLDSWAGGPRATLVRAMERLEAIGTVTARSSFYETAPVGFTEQPQFVNAVISMATPLLPIDLLAGLLRIEREFGRDRSATATKGPRTLDLDLLFFDDQILDLPQLALPHPAVAERRFVLQPLAEIAPGFIHPQLRKSVAQLLGELPDEGQNRSGAVQIYQS